VSLALRGFPHYVLEEVENAQNNNSNNNTLTLTLTTAAPCFTQPRVWQELQEDSEHTTDLIVGLVVIIGSMRRLERVGGGGPKEKRVLVLVAVMVAQFCDSLLMKIRMVTGGGIRSRKRRTRVLSRQR